MLGNNYNVVPPSLPGTPSTIASFADRYGRMAEALNEAVKELRVLANENVSISLAVDEVRNRASDAIDVTSRVAVRYQGAGIALNSYQASLSAAQAKANAARSTISSNNPRAAYWRNEEDRLTREILFNGSDPTLAADLLEASKWVSHYDGEYTQAMASYHAAEADRDAAVNLAIAGLNDASESAGLNDNLFEALEGIVDVLYDLAQKYLAPLIEILRDVLEIIKSIVDVIAMIVSILAIFIPALAPLALALTIVSLLLSAAILLCSLALFALGKETLGRVLGDLISFAASAITSKLGGVKFLSMGSQLSAGFSSVATSAGRAAISSSASITFNVLNGANADMVADVLIQTGKEELPDMLRDAGIGFAGDFLSDLTTDSTLDLSTSSPSWTPGTDPGSAALSGVTNILSLGGSNMVETIMTNGPHIAETFSGAVNTYAAVSAVPAG